MTKDLRNKQIYELKEMGVPAFAKALSPMIGKILSNYWGGNEILNQPDIIVSIGAASLRKVKRIGPKSLRMIAENLQRFGYIDNPDFWLAGR